MVLEADYSHRLIPSNIIKKIVKCPKWSSSKTGVRQIRNYDQRTLFECHLYDLRTILSPYKLARQRLRRCPYTIKNKNFYMSRSQFSTALLLTEMSKKMFIVMSLTWFSIFSEIHKAFDFSIMEGNVSYLAEFRHQVVRDELHRRSNGQILVEEQW